MALPVTRSLAQSPEASPGDADLQAWGRQVIAEEAAALAALAERVDGSFAEAVRRLRKMSGSLIVTGMGKAGLIGQKLAATFASTGTRAHYLHPAEAVHGDLGRVGREDLVLALSQSGETAEVVQLLGPLRAAGVTLVSITASPQSTLGRASDVTLPLGRIAEACPLGLAPSTSTAAMLALGDALALVVSRVKGFTPHDFARFHPGGALGRQLSTVDEYMRSLDECRLAPCTSSVREVLVASTRPGRRSGAIMLIDSRGELAGLFTDSDLARLIERRCDAALDRPIAEVMTRSPATIAAGSPLPAAIELLAGRKFSELPVVDDARRPVGLIDVTDVLEPPPQDARRGAAGALAAPRNGGLRVYHERPPA
jgi:arabinose-5-phosphate isomerase